MTRLILAGLIGWLAPHHAQPSPPACSSVAACRSELAHTRRALRWQRAARRRLERRVRVRFHRDVGYAITLASRVFGVDAGAMWRVARCESGGDPFATNGQYAGLFQESPSFITSTPLAGFSRFDPVASALAAASVVRVEGWRQWTCQP